MVWSPGPIIAVIHDVVPSDVKATAQALYILLIHLLGDTLPAIVGKLADLHNLQQACLLPSVIDVVAGVIFLVGCRRVECVVEAWTGRACGSRTRSTACGDEGFVNEPLAVSVVVGTNRAVKGSYHSQN